MSKLFFPPSFTSPFQVYLAYTFTTFLPLPFSNGTEHFKLPSQLEFWSWVFLFSLELYICHMEPKWTVYWQVKASDLKEIPPPQTQSNLILSKYFGSTVSIFQAATLPKILVCSVQNFLPKKVEAKSAAHWNQLVD